MTRSFGESYTITGEARSKEDFSDVFVIGIDETSRKKGHEYITLVVDNKDSRVIFACEGKDSSTISNFRKDLQNHNGTFITFYILSYIIFQKI